MKRNARQLVRLLIVALAGLVSMVALPLDRSLTAAFGDQPDSGSHPSPTETTGDIVFAKLVEFNHLRESRLQQYSVHTTYRVQNDKGETSAETRVLMRYRAPGTKEFKIVSEKGSGLIRSRVFKPLMDMEVETASLRNRYDSSITPNNYTFTLLGEEDVDGLPLLRRAGNSEADGQISVQRQGLDPRCRVCGCTNSRPARQKPLDVGQASGLCAALPKDRRILAAAQERVRHARQDLWKKYIDHRRRALRYHSTRRGFALR